MSDPEKETAVLGFWIGVVGFLAVVVSLLIGELYGLFDQ